MDTPLKGREKLHHKKKIYNSTCVYKIKKGNQKIAISFIFRPYKSSNISAAARRIMPLLINYSAAHYDNHDAFVTELQAYFMFALWPASVQYFPLKYKGGRLLLISSVSVKVLPGANASVYKTRYVTTLVWSSHTGSLSDASKEISVRK